MNFLKKVLLSSIFAASAFSFPLEIENKTGGEIYLYKVAVKSTDIHGSSTGSTNFNPTKTIPDSNSINITLSDLSEEFHDLDCEVTGIAYVIVRNTSKKSALVRLLNPSDDKLIITNETKFE